MLTTLKSSLLALGMALACLGLLLSGAPPARAAATAPSNAALTPQVLAAAGQLARGAAQAQAPRGARIVVQPLALDPRLRLAACARVIPFLPSGQPAWGRTRVGLRCGDDAVRWTVYLPMQVQVLAPAWVAREALAGGTTLAAGHLRLAEVDWAQSSSPPLAGAADAPPEDRVLARPVAAGAAVREADVKPHRWFDSGAMVQVVGTGSGFAVQTSGQALGPGVDRRPVRVRVDGGRVLVGLPVAANRVEITL